MHHTLLVFSAVFAAFLSVQAAFAGSTTVGGSVSRGQSSSMAYSLNVTQRFDPWIASEAFELAPLAELGGHAWRDNKDHVDTVWGGHLAPGLRFTLNTGKIVRPDLEASLGAAVNSEDHMDDRDFGSYVLLRTRGSVGLDFGDDYRHRLQGDYVHHSTAGLTRNDDGYNTYGLSYGYSF
jgi:hypothetical protein